MPTPDSVLSAMLSPALFMTATGSLLISANNRLARVVDRLRVLTDQCDQLVRGVGNYSHPGVRLEHTRGMIRLQQRRGNIILTAITLLYAAFGTFVGASLAIALNVLNAHIPPDAAIALAVIGVIFLLAASVAMLLEARLGVRALNRDVEFSAGITVAVEKPPLPE